MATIDAKQEKFQMTSRESLRRAQIQSQIDDCEAVIEKFRQNLSKDPLYTLEWATPVFDAAATISVCRNLQRYVKELGWKLGIERFIKFETEQVLSRAKWPSRSTSPCANLSQECYTAALAKTIETVTSFLD